MTRGELRIHRQFQRLVEGMHVSAVRSGHAPDVWEAQANKICDYSWKIDFGRLYEFVCGTAADVGRARLYGSRPPANDSLWANAKSKGFEVVVHDRNASNREKKVDTSIAVDILADSYELMKSTDDEITLVSGDGDFVPVIDKLRARGFVVEVVFWSHASRELQQAATRFIDLDPQLDFLKKK